MKTLFCLSLLCFFQTAHSEVIYRLQTTIGDHVFNDILVLDSVQNNIAKGSLSVPGVFSSPLEEGKITYNVLDFKVMAHEGNENYYVNYTLRLNQTKTELVGELKQGDQTIGEIKGTKIFEGK